MATGKSWCDEFSNIEEAIEALETLRGQILFAEFGDDLSEMARQHYLSALGALELAKSHMRLAAILREKGE